MASRGKGLYLCMEKNLPFVFGICAENADFTNRHEETKQLIRNFEGGINTILISPRRWGKTSLVAHVNAQLKRKNKKIRICNLDLFSVRNEADFYAQYSTAVLNAGGNKLAEAIDNARKYLGKLIPKISISPDPNSEIAVSLDWKEVKKNPADIMDLPEKIAKNKGIRMVVCMDEFQNISTFEDPLAFQKKFRSVIQKHKHVTYCFYGSKRHMLMEVFTKPSMPFYKFGDIIFLQKMTKETLSAFIQKRFRDTGKSISQAEATNIALLADCHPYYTQQLAQQAWLQTAKKCNMEIIQKSHERMCDQFSLFFQSLTDSLSATQVNFLEAFLNGESSMYATEILQKYKLGTSANVSKIKKALQEKEIIDFLDEKPIILDPYYAYWLQKRYFKIH